MLHRTWLRIVLASLLLALMAQIAAAAAPIAWSTPDNISDDTSDIRSASIVIDHAGRLHAVWSDGVTIYHKVRTGETWSDLTSVTSGSSPRLAAGPAELYMAFGDSLLAGQNRINWMTWTLSAGWKAAPTISDTEGNLSLSPQVAVAEDGKMAVVWSEPGGDASRIYLARSDDGTVWVVSPLPSAQGGHPTVAFVSGSDLLVAWEDELDPQYAPEMEIWASLQDEGVWGLPVDLSQTFAPGSTLPAAVVSGGSTYVAWQESGEEEGQQGVWLSQNAGGGWTHPVQLSGEEGGYAPSLSRDALGGVHLVWTAGSSVFYRSLQVSVTAWGGQDTVATGQTRPNGAQIATGDAGHVVWLASDGVNQEVWYSGRAAEVTPEPTVDPARALFIPLLLKG